jgi:hypothetical protein
MVAVHPYDAEYPFEVETTPHKVKVEGIMVASGGVDFWKILLLQAQKA